MNGIRFVHTDHLRLAGSISGLAAAPDWLRRLARDATRGAVSRVFEVAATENADFILIGGDCCDSTEFDSSVTQWLREPVDNLRRRGIRTVMFARRPAASDSLADLVIRPGEHLHVTRTAGQIQLSSRPAERPASADLVVSPAASGPCASATCNYLFQPAIRHAADTTDGPFPVYSAGAPQSHGPQELGHFGCLVVQADTGTGQVDVRFEETDPLRFEARSINQSTIITSQDICDAVVNESRDLARQQRRTTVVDWYIEHPVECVGLIESWRQESILDTVRNTLQKGHLGVWPRRVVVSPPKVRLSGAADSEGVRELTSLLFEHGVETRDEMHAAFAELVTGARLLSRAA